MHVLFVASLSSALAARWINQTREQLWKTDVFGFASMPHETLDFCGVTMANEILPSKSQIQNQIISTLKRNKITSSVLRVIKNTLRYQSTPIVSLHAIQLAELIDHTKPDIIHSLKTQNEGYLVAEALKYLRKDLKIPWVHSLWGSDLYYYGRVRQHIPLIKQVLGQCDYLLADNPRDILLASELGFTGKTLGVYPTGGGYPIVRMRESGGLVPPSQRRIIAVKGYQAKVGGQVLTALAALKKCGRIFDGYEIIIHSAIGTYASSHLQEVRLAADDLSRSCNVAVNFLPYSPYKAIWELFGRSRMAIAISNSDGTPNAMLEAMIMGAFPIQSNTGGLDEWIKQGINGALVPHHDINAISQAIVRALENDRLVDSAAEINYPLTEERLDQQQITDKVITMYQKIAAETPSRS